MMVAGKMSLAHLQPQLMGRRTQNAGRCLGSRVRRTARGRLQGGLECGGWSRRSRAVRGIGGARAVRGRGVGGARAVDDAAGVLLSAALAGASESTAATKATTPPETPGTLFAAPIDKPLMTKNTRSLNERVLSIL